MNVPDGWRIATLGEVCAVGPRDAALSEDAPFVPMDAVKVGRREPAYYEQRGRRGGIRARGNDLLFARITPCLENGKVALLPEQIDAVGGSTEFLVVRPSPEIDPRFLYFWSLTPSVRDRAKAEMTGTTGRMRLAGKSLSEFAIAFPGLVEQRRIVEMVEEHLAHLDTADASLTQAEQRATALTASSAAVIVAEAARVGKISTIGAHATAVEYGSSAKTSGDASGIPVLRMGNIQLGQLDWNSLKYLPKTHGEFPKLLLRDGDLLFNRTNSAELVGKCAVFHGERESSYASYLIRVRFDATVEADWVNIVINSPQGRAHIKTVVSQQVGQANVNGTKLRAFPLPVPDIAQQRELIAKHRHALDEAYRAEAAADSARRRSGALRRAVLAAAFAGRLSGAASDSDTIEEMAS
ncbi:restriction endonuclease subunit S [Dermacoccus abyssi]|uniref:restriction endonuclease subunit S n=1 Tax=Dermacoccus abyssi TaxID=322596 RepID=UPI0021A2771F|nr:restriction endonuclease subunit S [Dermacoccus abyssi]